MPDYTDWSVANDTRFVRSAWLATVVFVVYDHALTFSDELYYIWARGTRVTKCLYAGCRYGTFLVLMMSIIVCELGYTEVKSGRCQFCYFWLPYTGMITYSLDACVLTLRINALYGCDRRLRFFLFTLLSLLIVFGVAFFTVLSTLGAEPAGRGSRCWDIYFAPWAWIFWLSKAAFEGLLLALALARTLGAWLRPSGPPSALLQLLIRDAVVACAGTLSFALVNLVLWRNVHRALFYAFPGTSIAIESVIASRLLLNLHAYNSSTDNRSGKDGRILCIHSPEDLERIELTAAVSMRGVDCADNHNVH